MSAKDRFHDVVKKALQKEGWQITHDPLFLQVDGITDMYIDLGAEKIIAAEREGQKIAVEIKTFLGTSTLRGKGKGKGKGEEKSKSRNEFCIWQYR